MSYAVKEIFYTLQGEGAQAGRAAVFCRFAGCNLWSGRERTGLRRSASFATRILWAWMDRAAEVRVAEALAAGC
jgi:7-carboxy-7-deazaguanine synthase